MQGTPVVSDNTLPASNLYRAEERLTTVSFEDGNPLKITRSPNVNKTHSHDIFIRLLKMCDAKVVKPLSLIFKNCISLKFSQICGINQTLFQSIRKETSNVWLTIAQLHFY